jgi:hypothetical protein
MTIDSSAAWAALAAGGTPTRGEYRVFISDVAAAEGKALLALDPQGLRHLLIPVRAGVHVEADERSSGVHVLGRTLVDNNAATAFVDVACRKPHLAEVFGHLVDEVLEELAREPGKPGTIARRVLNRWRELLERERPGLLSDEELTGLFGELWVLQRLVEENPSALGAWSGPLGARFDFQCPDTALEAKTSLKSEGVVVHVHGIDQLEPPADGELFLRVLRVERGPGAGLSLPEVVQRIRDAGVDALAFTSKLHAAGFAESDARHYADTRFAVHEDRVYRVDDTFPRISRESFVSGDLPARIGGLRYTIDLTAPPPSPVSDAEKAGLVRRLAQS